MIVAPFNGVKATIGRGFWLHASGFGVLTIRFHGCDTGRWILRLDDEVLGIYPRPQLACFGAALGKVFSANKDRSTAGFGIPIDLYGWEFVMPGR